MPRRSRKSSATLALELARRGRAYQGVDDKGLHVPSKTLVLFGPVNRQMLERVTNGCIVFSQTKEPVQVLLCSPGGSVVDGLAIHDLLSALDNHLTIRVVGEASSMGAVILQAADHRAMGRNASLLLHDGSQDPGDMTVRDLERYTVARRKDRETFYRIFAERCGKTKAYFRRKMAHDWYLYAPEAKAEGLVDEIIE